MSSSNFDDVFNVNYIVPSIRSRRSKGHESARGLGITSVLTEMMQKIEWEEKVDWIEDRLGNLDMLCS